jgi:type IV pilus assembly protein PilQ
MKKEEFSGVVIMRKWVRCFVVLLFCSACKASPFDDEAGYFSPEKCEQSAYCLQYASVDTGRKALSKSGLLSKAGTWMYWDQRLNTILYCAMKKDKSLIMNLLKTLDKPIKQVKVGVKIVSVDEDWLESLGVQWDFNYSGTDATHSFLLMKSQLGIKILSQISAKDEKNRAVVVASPTLVTSNNEPAFIESGEKIPYQERNHDGDLSTVFQDALLRLSITPVILPKGNIHLKINLHYDKVSSFSVAGMPVIRAQQLQTDIVTSVGRLVVLGGIIENRQERVKERVPLLSQIPFLGPVFRYSKHASGQKQLLVFLYPEVVG